MIGKCGMTSAFAVVYVYTSELFPTSVRTTAVGTCSTIGHSGAVITPWVSDLVSFISRPCGKETFLPLPGAFKKVAHVIVKPIRALYSVCLRFLHGPIPLDTVVTM